MLTNNLFKRWTDKMFAPDLVQRATYEAFKRLLDHDRSCHELVADFQDLYYKNEPTEWTRVVVLYRQLSQSVSAIANELAYVSADHATDLKVYCKKFDSYIRFLLQPESISSSPPYVMWLNDAKLTSQLSGNKAANLARVHQNLNHKVPEGFVVTTNSWHALVGYNDLRPKIDALLLTLEPGDSSSIDQTSRALTSLIEAATVPPEIEQILVAAVRDLVDRAGEKGQTRIAVRSSAVNEDGPNSFAGQYESALDVLPEDVLQCYLQVLASKYSPKALFYRITAGISDAEASMAVLIIEMIQANAAGVIYTADPSGEEKDTVSIHSVTGGGEKLVSGKVRPHLSSFKKGTGIRVTDSEATSPINQQEAEQLAMLATDLDDFFGTPQDIEWVIENGQPFILQSRPLRTSSSITDTSFDHEEPTAFHTPFHDADKGEDCQKGDGHTLPLLFHGGLTAARGRGAGPAFILTTAKEEQDVPAGAVLIVESIPASLILHLSQCSAVISETGSVASHFSTICREFGVPLIVAVPGLKTKVVQGEEITVDADTQNVYRGRDLSLTTKSAATRKRFKPPYFRRLKPILDFIAPLTIIDPEAESFTPESCRSLHDIVRFAHETGVRAMFAIGKSGSRRGQRKQLVTTLPFELYLVDVDGSWQEEQVLGDTINPEQVMSTPFQALWQGLTHPSISWGDREYYNWKEYDSAALTDGFAFKNKTESASYAVCGRDYLNLNIRFGYHFTIVDTLCGNNVEQNYCSIRFAGGGGTFEGRYYRLKFIESILHKLGFQVINKTDLLDGRLESLSMEQMAERLVTLGRMLGTSKLMDMVLKDEDSVASHLELFFNCNDMQTGEEQSL
jgi:pyruvate,water dikinase